MKTGITNTPKPLPPVTGKRTIIGDLFVGKDSNDELGNLVVEGNLQVKGELIAANTNGGNSSPSPSPLPTGSNVSGYTETIAGDGESKSLTIYHNFATKNILVQVYDTDDDPCYCGYTRDENSITLNFTSPPSPEESFTVVIIPAE